MAITKLQCGISQKYGNPPSDINRGALLSRHTKGRTKRFALTKRTAVAKAKAAIRRTNLIDVDIAALMQEFNLTEGKVRTLIAKIRQERERGLWPHANASAQ